MTAIRGGEPADLPEVAAIQQASPGSARWNVEDYPRHDFRVAIRDGRVAGFLVSRRVAPDESEVLNLAVAPEFRRKDVARALMRAFLDDAAGTVYLEVRDSNTAARMFYKSMGFEEVSTRPGYYEHPPETAIVMKFHSC